MNLPIHKKGTDIEFLIQIFEDDEMTIPVIIDNLLDLRCYYYTSEDVIKKFAKETANGYTQLIRISSTTYKGIIEGSFNIKLKEGIELLAIWTASTDTEITTGRFKSAGIGQVGILESIITQLEV